MLIIVSRHGRLESHHVRRLELPEECQSHLAEGCLLNVVFISHEGLDAVEQARSSVKRHMNYRATS